MSNALFPSWPRMEYSLEMVKNVLSENDPILLGEAILALHSQQTHMEKVCKTTTEQNNAGFSMKTVSTGTYIATWLQGGLNRRISGKFIPMARSICWIHSKQITRLLNSR